MRTLLTVSTVSRSYFAAETVETVKEFFPNPTTPLKPGVNEKTFASGSEGNQSQESLIVMDWGPTLGAIPTRFQDIARAEFRKQRKRLGVLSAEQETAIEALLVSTANKISHRVLTQMRRLFETIG
jgi:hypothetical protein